LVEETITFASPRGRIVYRDSRDHFENGLLRLLHLDQAAFEAWLLAAEREDGTDVVLALGQAFQRLRPVPVSAVSDGEGDSSVEAGPDGMSGSLWCAAIAESPGFGVARSDGGGLGWLVKRSPAGAPAWRREHEPPAYEEAYFEGDPLKAGGYGDYAGQQGWRLEKARRQLREVGEVCPLPERPVALDIGSGYGFFRQALAEAGVTHDGLEISAHARAVAARLYGLETAGGGLAEHLDEWRGRYDLITLWDMLEHVAAPRAFLAEISSCLKPGGVIAMKTPNLDCPEAEIFGPHYHSLKREHLVYFSPSGIARVARNAGLDVVRVTSSSHLLRGFVGAERVERWAGALRGADLNVYLRRPRPDASLVGNDTATTGERPR
jgi:2-polyprenyl-3-methyl-5-hydroxy-6-metoxy-1,4-benzoquinol methylase